MNNINNEPRQVQELTKTEVKERWPLFKPSDFKNHGLMLIRTLDIAHHMCSLAFNNNGWQFHFNSTYRKGDPKSHGRGEAIDGYFYKEKRGDIDLAEQLTFILQFDWRGIGYYPYWKTPGWHVDCRTGHEWQHRRAIWWRKKDKTYAQGYSGTLEALNA